MKFGYENEFFLLDKHGEILHQVPSYKLPYDAHGTLVEVRSEAFENPYQTLASYNAKKAELEAAVAEFGCTLHNINEHQVMHSYPRLETAGFHIHFGANFGLNYDHYYNPIVPPDIKVVADMITQLDEAFKPYYTGVNRHPHIWRVKPYGFEYRRLPATTSAVTITQVLDKLFTTAKLEAAA